MPRRVASGKVQFGAQYRTVSERIATTVVDGALPACFDTCMKTTKEILQAARDKLAVPGAWCSGALARNSAGYPVSPRHSEDGACAWCAMGAVMSEFPEPSPAQEEVALCALRRVLPAPAGSVTDFNDRVSSSVEPVLAMFDRAIAACDS